MLLPEPNRGGLRFGKARDRLIVGHLYEYCTVEGKEGQMRDKSAWPTNEVSRGDEGAQHDVVDNSRAHM